MCSELLSNLLRVADNFASFKEVLLHVVRAHRLLWVIGISHGDVTFHNIMMKRGEGLVGVLNNFDLASIMEPGATSPPKTGTHRTGIPLFMSVELLRDIAWDMGVPRLYRHDLESFAWILLYASVCVKDGKENLDVEPFRRWVSVHPTQLFEKKESFLLHFTRYLPDKQWLVSTFAIWCKVILYPGDMTGPEEDPKLLGKVLRAWTIDEQEWENFSLAESYSR